MVTGTSQGRGWPVAEEEGGREGGREGQGTYVRVTDGVTARSG